MDEEKKKAVVRAFSPTPTIPINSLITHTSNMSAQEFESFTDKLALKVMMAKRLRFNGLFSPNALKRKTRQQLRR